MELKDYTTEELRAEIKLRNELTKEAKKQDEQNLANSAKTCKVEPKFKVGDWITNDKGHSYLIAHIDTDDNRYLFEIGGYTHEQMNWEYIENADNHYHLWSIKDAKDGDVLYSLDSKQPFIFKHRKPHEQAAVYCGINIYGKFFVENTNDCIITADKYIPADKFQRNLLFQKMKEAGYEWDDKKKKLKIVDWSKHVKCDPNPPESGYELDAENKELKKTEQSNEESNEGNFDIAGLYYTKAILEKTLGKVEGYQSDDGILEHKSAINAVTKLCDKISITVDD